MRKVFASFVLSLALMASLGASPTAGRTAAECRSPLLVDRLNAGDGLSHNAVFAVTQDRVGFLWIGTQGGLDRWDGRSFVSYRPREEDESAPESRVVRALLEDGTGRLWVGTTSGLLRLGIGRERFERISLPVREEWIQDLAEDGDGRVWVATDRSVLRFQDRGPAEVVLREADRPESVFDLIVDEDGRPWALTGVPGPASLHPLGGGPRDPITLSRFRRAAAAARDGGIWLDDARRLVPGDSSSFAVEGPEGYSAVHEDRTGRLWMGTYQGLFVREPSGRPCRVGRHPDAPHRLYDEINTLFEDRDGAIWIGTFGGLLRHDPRRNPFHHLPATKPDPSVGSPLGDESKGEPVSSVAVGPEAALWVGTYGNGLLRLDPETGFRRETWDGERNPCSDYLWDLEPGDDGALWVATADGLCRFEPSSGRIHLAERLGGRWIRDVERGTADRLWLAGSGGLYLLDGPRPPSLVIDTGANVVLDTVHVDADGIVWGAGGVESGILVRHSPGEKPWVAPSFLPEGIWDIHRDRRGTLWLATGIGLRWLENTPDGFVARRVPGLPEAAVIYSLREDERGRLWAGTSRGILRYDPAGGTRPRLFDLEDGTGSLEFNRHAATTVGDTLYFGGMRGVTRFRPKEIRGIETVPPVVVTDIRIVGRAGERNPNPFLVDALFLEPDETTLEVEFVALAFTQAKRHRYRYRLEGFDQGWVQADGRGFARYTGVDPGRYLFRASGSNADGVWNETGVTLPVVVRPAFWETLWFRGLAVVMLAAGLLAWHRHRVASLLAMERLRVRIAGDLHDDLSSDLSGVALAAESVARHPELTDEDRARLGQVRDVALDLVQGVRDIVWSINPEHDTMEATVRRMRQVSRDLLLETEWSFDVTVEALARGIDMSRRRDLLLIYKEALHNVAQHAYAEHVEVAVGTEGTVLVLRIEDDGIGFDPDEVEYGNGVENIRRRASAMGAEIDLWSRPGQGTRLVLRIPKTRDGGVDDSALDFPSASPDQP